MLGRNSSIYLCLGRTQIGLSRKEVLVIKPLLCFACLAMFLAAQKTAPERKVEGNSIYSAHDPHVRVQLPDSVQYVGADRWNLYDIADCELHAFVDPDMEKNVQRLYWVQFEGYLPGKPDLDQTKPKNRCRDALCSLATASLR